MSPSVFSIRLLLTQSDSRLVEFARAGHERAFEALVQRYRRPLLGYCRRLLLSEERAEDALQQALLGAWLALRSGTEVNDVKPWLYKIVHNAALNTLRVSGYDYVKLSESLSGAEAPQEDLDRRIAVREALAGLAALPQMQREALLRTAVEGGTHQQVARELGLSEPALRGLVYRARSTLRAAAGAVIPAPLVSWALQSGGRGTPVIERLAEVGAGGGSAGVAGLLMKGGAVAVTASMLAGGISVVHSHAKTPHRHSLSPASHQRPHTADTPLALVAARVRNPPPTQVRLHTHAHGVPSPIHLTAPHIKRSLSQPSTIPLTTAITPPPPPAISNPHKDGRHHGAGEGGGHDGQSASPSGVGTAASTGGVGQGSGHLDHGGGGGGGSTSHGGRDGGTSSEGTGTGSPAASGSQDGSGSSGGQGGGATSQPPSEESSDAQDSHGSPPSGGTSSSSKVQQAPTSEEAK
jgi:RNA polymerase sigma factor (sigma-70 family)